MANIFDLDGFTAPQTDKKQDEIAENVVAIRKILESSSKKMAATARPQSFGVQDNLPWAKIRAANSGQKSYRKSQEPILTASDIKAMGLVMRKVSAANSTRIDSRITAPQRKRMRIESAYQAEAILKSERKNKKVARSSAAHKADLDAFKTLIIKDNQTQAKTGRKSGKLGQKLSDADAIDKGNGRDSKGRFLPKEGGDKNSVESDMMRKTLDSIMEGVDRTADGISDLGQVDPFIESAKEMGEMLRPAFSGTKLLGAGLAKLSGRGMGSISVAMADATEPWYKRMVNSLGSIEDGLLKKTERKITGEKSQGAGILGSLATILSSAFGKLPFMGALKKMGGTKGVFGGLGGMAKTGGRGLKGILGKGLRRVPILGALLGVADFAQASTMEGSAEDRKRAQGRSLGGTAGMIAGGAAGAFLGPIGAIVGATLGGWLGGEAGEIIADNMDGFLGWLKPKFEFVAEGFRTVSAKIGTAWGFVTEGFGKVKENIGKGWDAMVLKLEEWGKAAFELLPNIVKDTMKAIAGKLGVAWDFVNDKVSTAATAVSDAASNAGAWVGEKAGNAAAAVGNATSAVTNWVGESVDSVKKTLRIKTGQDNGSKEGTYYAMAAIQKSLGSKLTQFGGVNDNFHVDEYNKQMKLYKEGKRINKDGKNTAPSKSRHITGEAFDMSLSGVRNASGTKHTTEERAKINAALAKVDAEMKAKGLVAGRDYKVIDEYAAPAKNATAGHIHVQFNGDGAAKFASAAKGGNVVASGAPSLSGVIAKGESHGGDYNAVNLGRKKGNKSGKADLTTKTINQVLAMQKAKEFNAAGKYQIIPSTMEELKKKLKLTGNELFDESMQDKMGAELAFNRPNFRNFITGKSNNVEAAQQDIANEWSSMPQSNGKGRYDDDGVNKALHDPKIAKEAIIKAKTIYASAMATGLYTEKQAEYMAFHGIMPQGMPSTMSASATGAIAPKPVTANASALSTPAITSVKSVNKAYPSPDAAQAPSNRTVLNTESSVKTSSASPVAGREISQRQIAHIASGGIVSLG